jgi:hypothetical protein
MKRRFEIRLMSLRELQSASGEELSALMPSVLGVKREL